MKTTFFVLSLVVAVIAIFIDLGHGRGGSIGFFLLSSAMMISSVLCKTEHSTEEYCRSMHKVYSSLAGGAIDMETLMKRVTANCSSLVLSEHYKFVIGRMLSKRQIIIVNGMVIIGDGIDTAS